MSYPTGTPYGVLSGEGVNVCRPKGRIYDINVFIPKGTFYTNLAIKYLMTCFYTTGIGTECIMTIPLGAIHIL